jgi:hypothetical protein
MKKEKTVNSVKEIAPRPNVIERVKAIQSEFSNMTSLEGRKSPFAIAKLAKKYFLASRTVEDIVYRTGYYKNI